MKRIRVTGRNDIVEGVGQLASWQNTIPRLFTLFRFGLVLARFRGDYASMMNGTHENFSRNETITAGSDRSFGIVMAGGFSVLALLNGWHGGKVWPLMAGIAVLFLAAALLYPAVLKPLNGAWLKFGLLLHKLVNPIVMGLVFFGTVLPTGLVMRAMGKDLLRLKLQPDADSYWIVRQPPGPAPETMIDQF